MSTIIIPTVVFRRIFTSKLTWLLFIMWAVFLISLLLYDLKNFPYLQNWQSKVLTLFALFLAGYAAILFFRYNTYNYILKIDSQNQLLLQREKMLTRFNEKLVRQSEFLKLVTNSFAHPFVVVDADTYSIIMANKAFYKVNNLPDNFDLFTKKCHEISHHYNEPCNDGRFPCPMKEAKEKNKPITAQHMHKDTHGKERVVEINAFPVFDKTTGKVKQVIEYSVDITKRIQEQSILAESEERLRTIITTSPDGIAVADLDGTITFASEKTANLLGIDNASLLTGRSIFDFLPPDELKEARATMEKLITRQLPFITQEFKTIRSDGSVFYQETNASLLFDKSYQPYAVTLITRDITERKIAQERQVSLNNQLKEKSIALEELNKSLEIRIKQEVDASRQKDRMLALQSRQAAMGEMLGNIAHQWRQPLNTINLIIFDMLEAHNHGELNNEYLQHSYAEINKVVQSLSQTIDDFRNFFKPNKEKKVFDVIQVIEQSLSFTHSELNASNIKVSFNKNEQAFILGYPNELMQTLISILNNAKEALTKTSPRKKHIQVECFQQQGKVFIKVCNNGGTISYEHLEKIFDPYYTTKPEGQGTGLGLYISKTIIENNMQGKLSATNTTDGVCFEMAFQHYSE